MLSTPKRTYANWAEFLNTPTHDKQLPLPSTPERSNQTVPTIAESRVNHYVPKKEDFLSKELVGTIDPKTEFENSANSWLPDLNLSINKP